MPGQVIILGQSAVVFIGAGGPQGRYILQHIAVVAGVVQLHGVGNIIALVEIVVEYISTDTAPEEIQILIDVAGLELIRLPVRHAGAFQQAAEHG